jgi:hypothetical protein
LEITLTPLASFISTADRLVAIAIREKIYNNLIFITYKKVI